MQSFFINFFLFTFPLEAIGVHINGYPVTIPFLSFCFISLVSLLTIKKGYFLKKTTFFAILFISWSFVTCIGRHPVNSYLPHISILILLIIPVLIVPRFFCFNKSFLKWMYYGCIFSFSFLYYDLCVYYFGFTKISDLTSLIFPGVNIYEYSTFRVKASFLEPSHYAQYLVFIYVILDKYNGYVFSKKWEKILKWHVLMALFFTLSMAGFIILICYFFMKFYYIWNGINYVVPTTIGGKGQRSRYHIHHIAIFIIFLFLFFLVLINNQYIEVRYNSILSVLQSRSLEGSAGVRLNTVWILFDYLTNEGLRQTILGEGFANIENWLIDNFASTGFLVGSGSVQNIFVYIGMATGVIGLVIYLIFVFLIKKSMSIDFFILWILLHFSSGYFIFYKLWGILFIIQKIRYIDESNNSSTCSHMG